MEKQIVGNNVSPSISPSGSREDLMKLEEGLYVSNESQGEITLVDLDETNGHKDQQEPIYDPEDIIDPENERFPLLVDMDIFNNIDAIIHNNRKTS